MSITFQTSDCFFFQTFNEAIILDFSSRDKILGLFNIFMHCERLVFREDKTTSHDGREEYNILHWGADEVAGLYGLET